MVLGRRLGLCSSGISFPGHFPVTLPYGGGEVVLDLYCGGVSLSTEDLVQRLQAVLERDIDLPARSLSAASNKQILARMLLNLKGIYQQQGKIDKMISVMNKLLLGMPDMINEYRERGLLLNSLGCHHAALNDFQRYLRHRPDAPDAGAVRELVFKLREHTAGSISQAHP
jgi:regulator of sirC expression with transglutaminase-like and TPR domain